MRGDEIPWKDLRANMPAVDSKTVARTAPLFERHLGSPLDVQRIRQGGYDSIDDITDHLVYGNHGDGQVTGHTSRKQT